MATIKKELLYGSFWSIVGQFGTLLITFGANIWLARLLSPVEFGQVSIIMFFIIVTSILTESGLGGALVRIRNASPIDYSTVFVTNLGLSIFLFLVIIIISFPVSSYFDDPKLRILLIVSSFVIIINAFQVSIHAKMVKEMRFKQKYIYKFYAIIISSLVAIVLAYLSFGVWSLVIMHLANAFVFTFLLWKFERGIFSLQFSKSSFKTMYSFGLFTTLSALLTSIFDNLYQIVLAKYFSIIHTGNFYQAKRFQDVPGGVLNAMTQGVVFSALSKYQDNKKVFFDLYSRINKYFSILLGVIAILIYLYAEQIVWLFLGANWTGVVFFMKLLTIASFFYMQESFNRVIFKVYDKTKSIFFIDVFKKTLQSIGILLGIFLKNMEILIWSFVIVSVLGYFINFFLSRRILLVRSNLEIINIFKIIVISITVVIIFSIIREQGSISFLLMPAILIIYFSFLFFLRVLSVVEVLNVHKMLKSF